MKFAKLQFRHFSLPFIPINSNANTGKCGKGYPKDLFKGFGDAAKARLLYGKGTPDKERTWPPPGISRISG
jgi:hypothetical protein